jgi:hypothetical protein
MIEGPRISTVVVELEDDSKESEVEVEETVEAEVADELSDALLELVKELTEVTCEVEFRELKDEKVIEFESVELNKAEKGVVTIEVGLRNNVLEEIDPDGVPGSAIL